MSAPEHLYYFGSLLREICAHTHAQAVVIVVCSPVQSEAAEVYHTCAPPYRGQAAQLIHAAAQALGSQAEPPPQPRGPHELN